MVWLSGVACPGGGWMSGRRLSRHLAMQHTSFTVISRSNDDVYINYAYSSNIASLKYTGSLLLTVSWNFVEESTMLIVGYHPSSSKCEKRIITLISYYNTTKIRPSIWGSVWVDCAPQTKWCRANSPRGNYEDWHSMTNTFIKNVSQYRILISMSSRRILSGNRNIHMSTIYWVQPLTVCDSTRRPNSCILVNPYNAIE